MTGPAFPNALTEIDGMTQAVTTSDLDWTIARITSPKDKPAKGSMRAGFLGRDWIGSAMTSTDIAAFLVSQLTDDTNLRAAPAIKTEKRGPRCVTDPRPAAQNRLSASQPG